MTSWDGNGPTPPFSLTDDEVRALVRNIAYMSTTPADTFGDAMRAYQKLQARAEEIINAERARRHHAR